MSSADEDDVHQCGRCKALFHSIEEYFTHKKAKSCTRKEKSGPRVLFEDVNADGERSILNTPKYIPNTSSFGDSFLGFVNLNSSNDAFLQDAISKDGLLPKTNTFLGLNFDDSKSGNGLDKQLQNKKSSQKIRHPSSQTSATTSRRKGRPKKAGEIACTLCDFKASYQKVMDQHVASDHKLHIYICQHCDASFKSRSHLNDHLQVCLFRGSKSSTSKVPESAISREKEGNLDENANFKKTDFECQDCGRYYDSYNYLCKHVAEEHKDISPGICRFCGRWFSTKYKFFKHLTTEVHPEVSEVKMKAARADISHHKIHWKVPKYHAGHKTFRCKNCDIKFDHKQDLITHNMEQHAAIKKYICENCGDSFRTQRLYLNHLNSHGIQYFEPGFKCPACEKQFQQKVHVCRHIETLHTPLQEIPDDVLLDMETDLLEIDDADKEIYTCFVCCKQLISQAKMQKHLQLHRVWCINTPEGPQASGTDVLFEEYYRKNSKSLKIANDVNQPSLAVLHGMKPIQDGISDPASLPSIAGREVQEINKEGTKGQDARNYSRKEPEVSDATQTVLPSMPLELADPSAEIVEVPLDDVGSPNQDAAKISGSNHRGHNQCSTIDQSALRDLVEALETISNNQFGKPSNLENSQTQGCSDDDLNRRLDALGGDVAIPEPDANNLQSEATSEELHKEADCQKKSQNHSHTCPFCLKTFDNLKDCYDHKIKDHNLVAVFRCVDPNCKRIFQSASEFENHSREHSQLAFICSVCNEHFVDLPSIISHKSSAHRLAKLGSTNTPPEEGSSQKASESDDNPSSFLCDQCGCTFSSKPVLNRHRLVHHTRTSDFVCKECGAVFKNKEHLKRHERTVHSSEKPFRCTFEGCGKAFGRKDKLRDHWKAHTPGADKSYICQYCQKAYRFKNGLKNHERTHQDELKYFCTMCEGAFSKPAMLRAHMAAVHQVNLKKSCYPCHQCGKIFNRPERLKRHREKAHATETVWKFNCSICHKGFSGQTSFSTHMARKHAGVDVGKVANNVVSANSDCSEYIEHGLVRSQVHWGVPVVQGNHPQMHQSQAICSSGSQLLNSCTVSGNPLPVQVNLLPLPAHIRCSQATDVQNHLLAQTSQNSVSQN